MWIEILTKVYMKVSPTSTVPPRKKIDAAQGTFRWLYLGLQERNSFREGPCEWLVKQMEEIEYEQVMSQMGVAEVRVHRTSNKCAHCLVEEGHYHSFYLNSDELYCCEAHALIGDEQWLTQWRADVNDPEDQPVRRQELLPLNQ